MVRMTASKTSPPQFVEPWHADLFAMTLEMSDKGHFSWTEWTTLFGANQKDAVNAGGPTDGSDYYDVWLTTLEVLLAEKNLISPNDLVSMRDAWSDAYLATPHGQPVRLQYGS